MQSRCRDGNRDVGPQRPGLSSGHGAIAGRTDRVAYGRRLLRKAPGGAHRLPQVDTEGSDLEVLMGFHNMIGAQRIDLIQVEAAMNPFNKRHVDFASFCGYLEVCNYCLFGIYNQIRETRGRPMLRKSSPVFSLSKSDRGQHTKPSGPVQRVTFFCEGSLGSQLKWYSLISPKKA